MTEQILEGLRVVDLSQGLAGPVATLMLAEAGADVIKVEPPQGDPTRRMAAFATWNRSKRSIVLDLHDHADRATLDRLLEAADVLVHGLRPLKAQAVGLDDDVLRSRFPSLVFCSILGYPVGHDDAERPGWDLLVQARSGLMDEQLGYRDGPIASRFPGPSWTASYLAAAGILARLLHRDRTGLGGPVHTSLLQGMLNTISLVWNRAQHPDSGLLSSKYDNPPQLAMYLCADGDWLQIMNPGERIDIGALPLTQSTLQDIGERTEQVDAHALIKAFLQHPSDTWLEALRAADVAVEKVVPLGDLLSHPEAAANRHVLEIEDPVWGHSRQAAVPFDVAPPARVQRAAPILGAHTEEIVTGLDARDRVREPSPEPASGEPGPHLLSGLRVLDVGQFLAGPMAPMLLGDLGADVIKIEPPTGDRMRFMSRFFEACSRGKRSIAVDLTRPEGREVLARLISWADVVHHNQRMKAAGKLGIDEAGLRAVNPDVVFGYTSAYGLHGSRAGWPGFDSVFQALAGWEMEQAGEGNPPQFSRFGTLDVQCALSSLVATLLALYRKATTGEATTVTSSLLSASTITQSETLLRSDGTGLAPYPRLDHDQTGLGPGYRIHQASDGWVAVVAPDQTSRAALRAVAAVDVDDELVNAFRNRTAGDVLAALDAADVAGEPVRLGHMDVFFDDPANIRAGLVVGYEHQAYGRIEQPGAYWSFGDVPLKLDRAGPVVGEHTREILVELGYDEDEIDALAKTGVVRGPGLVGSRPDRRR